MNLFPGLTAWATVMPGLRPWNGVDAVDVVDEFPNSDSSRNRYQISRAGKAESSGDL